MFVTSTVEVSFPRGSDLIAMRLDYLLDLPQLHMGQLITLYQLDSRFDPEFGLSIPAIHVDMHPHFFAGEKEKPVTLFAKYRRAFCIIVPDGHKGTVRITCALPSPEEAAWI
jgi:hypothetical protein